MALKNIGPYSKYLHIFTQTLPNCRNLVQIATLQMIRHAVKHKLSVSLVVSIMVEALVSYAGSLGFKSQHKCGSF